MTPGDWWLYGSAAFLVYVGGALLVARYTYGDAYNGHNHDDARMWAAWIAGLWPVVAAVIVVIGAPCGIGWLLIIGPYKAIEWVCRKLIVNPVQRNHERTREPSALAGEPVW